MKFQIDSEIIKKTDCDKDFMCLEEEATENLCEICRCLNDQYCLLKKVKFGHCINRFLFGYSSICKCPVRIEIYNKYGV